MDVLAPPDTLTAWEAQRRQIRAVLQEHLGIMPPLFTPQPTITHDLQREGYRLQRIAFENGVGAVVYGYLLIPDGLQTPAPAVLYNHFYGGKYDLGKNELFQDRLTDPPQATALTRAGYVVLAIDAYAFGERQSQGPAGEQEVGAATELSLSKKFLWEGSTLWGMMLHDDLLALNYLLSRSEVDPTRIGTTGMSMGGSRATWLAALDERIKVTIPVAQMTRYRNFAARGEFWRHGIYYYIPAILATEIDMEHIVSLCAPRPQIILIGDQDPLSPLEGVRTIDAFARRIYGLYGAEQQYRMLIYEGIAHQYTAPMYAAMLEGFRQFL